jgi:PAS domain S-box-containing protein
LHTIESLDEQSALLDETIQTIAQGVVVFDARARLVAFNPQFAEFFEFPTGFLRPGMPIEDIIRYRAENSLFGEGDIGEQIRYHVQRAEIRTERSDERTLSNGKSYIYHRKPMSGGGFVATYTDITERKKMEHMLRESEEKFRGAFDNAGIGIFIRSADGKGREYNRALCDMLGYSAEELRSMRMREIAHPDDDPESTSIRYVSFGDLDTQTIERRFIRKDGKVIWCNISYKSVYDRNGRPLSTIGMLQEITERKLAEQRAAEKSQLLEATFRNMVQGIAVFDRTHTLIAFNPQYAQILDLPPDFLRIGMDRRDIIRYRAQHGDYGGATTEVKIEERLAASFQRESSERTLPSGRAYSYERTPMPGGGYIATVTDITERTRAEKVIRDAKEKAELANRAKSEFLANMSHELRTPLNAIIGFSEVMMQQTFDPTKSDRYLEFVENINTSGQHLLSLINDILDLSKIEAGKEELNEEVFEPVSVIRSCLNMVKGQSISQELRFAEEFAGGVPRLRADKRLVRQILLNLLSNAVKFTPKGGKITVRAWSEPDRGHVLQVIDTGIGVARKDIPNIFKPFAQIDSKLNRRHQGTGLGLALVKNLVELHGGSLEFESEPGAGSTVTVRFPKSRMTPAP